MARYYLGIDIGGTAIKAVLLRGLTQQKPELALVPTPRTKRAFIQALVNIIQSTTGGKNLAGIGIGIPGIVDQKSAVILTAPNIPFLKNTSMKNLLQEFPAPIRIENDARCFTFAEAAWGAAAGYRTVVGMTIGTGIGSAMIIDGDLYRGATNGAGEIGHMVIGITRQGTKGLKMKNHTFESIAAKDAFRAHGDRSEVIGIGVANLINMFDPHIVVLGGGAIASGAVKTSRIARIARRHLVSPRARHTPIRSAALGHAASAIGAALLWTA